ncbi:MAG: hypothetical protein Q9182_007325 [Xanthomendoza sp. 2 TL-2023]
MQDHASIFRYAKFDPLALCHIASRLRGGQSCYCDLTQTPKTGSFNWAVFLLFADGVEWVLRSPRKGDGVVSDDTNLLLLASEAATLKYIKRHSTIPVPEVFSYQASADNDVGIPYILMSKAKGSPLHHAWQYPESLGTEEQRAKVLFQLGAITWKLSRLRFSQAGSLFEESGEFKIKTCLSRGLLMQRRDDLEDVPRGPFSSENDFYEAHFTAFLEHVRYLPLSHHCFLAPLPMRGDYGDVTSYLAAVDRWNYFVAVRSKIDSSLNRTDYVIAGDALLGLMAKWTQLCGYFCDDDQHRFVLYHPDLNVNNIYVDENFNITCIIDWAFCSAIPLAMLLIPPGLPQSRNELDNLLLPAFEEGFRQGLEENLPEEAIDAEYRLSWIASRNRPMWLFTRLLNLDSEADYGLFKSIWEATGSGEPEMLSFFRSMQTSEKYVSLQKELAEDDATASELVSKEWRCIGSNMKSLAISRKLTLVSEWSTRYSKPGKHSVRRHSSVFVADKKLWTWIDCCLKTSIVS